VFGETWEYHTIHCTLHTYFCRYLHNWFGPMNCTYCDLSFQISNQASNCNLSVSDFFWSSQTLLSTKLWVSLKSSISLQFWLSLDTCISPNIWSYIKLLILASVWASWNVTSGAKVTNLLLKFPHSATNPSSTINSSPDSA
jgi:hypothetical protein